MKVVIITAVEPKENRGLGVVAFNHAKELQEKGFSVSIFCRGDEQKSYHYNGIEFNTFKYQPMKNSILNFIKTSQEAVSAWKYYYSANPPDVIHGHDYIIYSSIVGSLNHNTRKVFTVHDPLVYHQRMLNSADLNLFKKVFFTQIEKKVYKYSDSIHYISEYTYDRFVSKNQSINNKLMLVENWVDYDRFVVPKNKELIMKELEIDDEFVIFTLRALEPRMGLDRLIKAYKIFHNKVNVKTKLVIGGKGPMLNELIRLKNELNLNSVDFLGYVPDEDVVKWYQIADLVVVPSLDGEGFGLPIIEAMACGTPVLATPNCAIPEILSGKRDRLFKGDRAENIAEGLLGFYKLYLDKKLPSMNEERAYVLERYSKEVILDKILKSYIK